jgi:adenylosuccinate synthase
MINKAVIGLGFGDEGKGIVTDYLCSLAKNPIVRRFSGGPQAGHTVVLDGVKHVFSHYGSGALRGCDTEWAVECPMDPLALLNERSVLIAKGVKPRIFISMYSPVITPFEQAYNRQISHETGHGTCGIGFGDTIQREEDHHHIQFRDLFDPAILKIKLDLLSKYYNILSGPDLDDFYKACDIITSGEVDVNFLNDMIYFNQDQVIFEGSQGLLLDQDIGFFPHVTRSNTGLKNIYDKNHIHEVFLVTRAYQTRHGNGPMTNEDLPHNIKSNPEETNKGNFWQGELRISLLDLDLLSYAIDRETLCTRYPHNLVITCMDHIENEYRFTHEGKIVDCDNESDFVKKIKSILKIDGRVFLSHSPESKNIKMFK